MDAPTTTPAPGPPSGIAGLLEREAGHVVISLVLIFIGAGLWFLKVPKAEDLIPFATGVLARSMIGRPGSAAVNHPDA
jgi:hypothetical protein